MTNGNDNAYPYATHDQDGRVAEIEFGLTKREYFAAMAMQGMLSNDAVNRLDNANHLFEASVKAADALINALNKKS